MNVRFTSSLAMWVLSTTPLFANAIEPAHAEMRYSEEDMLPVRSASLTPGVVERRALSATGLPPFFLIGDDARSRVWLKQRLPMLIKLNAVGLVVNIDSKAALERLRHVATGLTLSPVSADDLAHRLHLQHYPVLITTSSLEQ